MNKIKFINRCIKYGGEWVEIFYFKKNRDYWRR